MRPSFTVILVIAAINILRQCVDAFIPRNLPRTEHRASHNDKVFWSTATSSVDLTGRIDELKQVLNQEYTSFFDPMQREYYANGVTFVDPLSSLEGVDGYQANVDMLAGRTMVGKILFRDANIVLHKIEGGIITDDGTISNMVTRWTLRITFAALPWSPTARFTGISDYKLQPGGPRGLQIMSQTDYWDSINLTNGMYMQVGKSKAISDMLNQIKPEGFQAASVGPELPYQLLRRAQGYEVRSYPSFKAAQITYQRRDEALGVLGSFVNGMTPLAPALMTVPTAGDKIMLWPLTYRAPGAPSLPEPNDDAFAHTKEHNVQLCTIPARVVAVRTFSNAVVEPVVRKANDELRDLLTADGLDVVKDAPLQFAQFDAVFSMGSRRGEVWIPLEPSSHPWTTDEV